MVRSGRDRKNTESRRRSMTAQSQHLQGTAAADRRGVPPTRRPASRPGRSPAATHRQAIPFRTRTTRRSHLEEAQASAEGSHGRHPEASSDRAKPRQAPSLQSRAGRDWHAAARAELIRTRIDSAGFPFIVGALGLAAASGAVVSWALAAPFLVLTAFFFFFFRDPERPADRRAGTALGTMRTMCRTS